MSCGDVLMVPLGLQGHVTPMVHVAKGLLKRGITITMILYEDRQTLVNERDIEEGFNLKLVKELKEEKKGYGGGGRGSGGFGRGDDAMKGGHREMKGGRGDRKGALVTDISDFERSCEPFLSSLLAEKESGAQGGPKCIIADQFVGWSQSWADKLHIPRYVVIASPATFAWTMYNHSSLIAHGLLADKDADPIINLPGIPLLHLSDLTGAAKMNPEFITSSGDTFESAAGILFNSFYDLESVAIDTFHAHLKAKNTGVKGPRMLPIGPMLPIEFFSEDTFEGTADKSECIQWLNTRPVSSVVYIAFGSNGYLSPPQILELAHGLEASQVSFLWVLRVKSSGGTVDVSKLLPPDFLEQTRDRGFVYSEFAPQLQILSHPATAGFLTHCGWNSSLESICRGIPMIGWPMGAEQKLCCRVLADEGKVAVEVKPGLAGRRELVHRDDLTKALRHLMIEPEGRVLKKRALELQRQARAAVAPGGFSLANFEILVKEIQSSNSRVLQAQ